MSSPIKDIVVLGGGTAGWLTAAVIAAEHCVQQRSEKSFSVTLLESPDVPTLGVGEGTWPSMRNTLKKIGVRETDFIRECDASFKQGTFFKSWRCGAGDTYAHPFTIPHRYQEANPALWWRETRPDADFAESVCPQASLLAGDLAPKDITTPEYAFNANYGYHLDAGKFAGFLRKHATTVLGVRHLCTRVISVNASPTGDIASLETDSLGAISGDLFIDCSGSRALLLGDHYGIDLVAQDHILFNDTALAVQLDYPDPQAPIASATLATAQSAGWIWNIGLPTRRGVGYVFSSHHVSVDHAEIAMRDYLGSLAPAEITKNLSPRQINFQPGYRAKFWHKNCVAIGMSAGFIEPLEASALVLVEKFAGFVAEELPSNRTVMDVIAKRFNRKFSQQWSSIIDFLKLHYAVSERQDSQYWKDHRLRTTQPESLRENLARWRHQAPWHHEAVNVDDLFPSASFQYVLYGMGFSTAVASTDRRSQNKSTDWAGRLFAESAAQQAKFQQSMPSNRALLDKVVEYGFQTL